MTLPESVQETIDQASEAVAGAWCVTALVGARMPAESGVPTFRGPGGPRTKCGNLRRWWSGAAVPFASTRR